MKKLGILLAMLVLALTVPLVADDVSVGTGDTSPPIAGSMGSVVVLSDYDALTNTNVPDAASLDMAFETATANVGLRVYVWQFGTDAAIDTSPAERRTRERMLSRMATTLDARYRFGSPVTAATQRTRAVQRTT